MKQASTPHLKPPRKDSGEDESLDPVGPIRGAPAERAGTPPRPKTPSARQAPPKAGQPKR